MRGGSDSSGRQSRLTAARHAVSAKTETPTFMNDSVKCLSPVKFSLLSGCVGRVRAAIFNSWPDAIPPMAMPSGSMIEGESSNVLE